ncbi:hypothetical protein [Sulfuricurvum sp.]|uniref:hypothetical protein n=1 Tax=Sulfuricurvum sp. TaxID=2025608 RepID=UPI00260B6799|nr:hypothetical protein [Sulfuricurvum sp.]MDD3595205.1 hypothetical protein [Sulfuricurvum sp.]
MNNYHNKSKRLLATALITTGLLGTTPLMSEEIIQAEPSAITQEKISPRIDSQLCNQQFQCTKTGFILHFLPEAKARFIHPQTSETLHADYRIHFDHSIAMNVYENPSKHFDLMMHHINISPNGFSANVNGEARFFEKV